MSTSESPNLKHFLKYQRYILQIIRDLNSILRSEGAERTCNVSPSVFEKIKKQFLKNSQYIIFFT